MHDVSDRTLAVRWVPVTDEHGRTRLEMRWQVPAGAGLAPQAASPAA